MTFSEVARSAGVTRQLMYRWWPARASLVSEALFGSGLPSWPFGYPGPLDSDVRLFVGAVVDVASRADVRAGIVGLMSEADAATPLPGLVDGLLTPLRRSLGALIESGVARGDVREGLDVDLTLNTIRGAVTMHLIADQTPPKVVVDHLSQLLTWAFRRN